MSDSLLAAALSAITENTVITYDDYVTKKLGDHVFYDRLDQKSLHQSHLVGGEVPTSASTLSSDTPSDRSRFAIIVKLITNRTITLHVTKNETIDQLKKKVKDKEGISPEEQKLIFNGKALEGDRTLSDYKVVMNSTIYLVTRLLGGGHKALYLDPNQLAPGYNYDFTNINDNGVTFMRGNFEYKRPCGWNRIAINVLNKYENDIWLGASGSRKSSTSSVPNEWPGI
jgi:hypothetical protein